MNLFVWWVQCARIQLCALKENNDAATHNVLSLNPSKLIAVWLATTVILSRNNRFLEEIVILQQ